MPRLADLTRSDLAALIWNVDPEPVISPPFPSPVIADPTFLPPDRTPDGQWRLWAHSLLGLHAFRSLNGLSWRRQGYVTRNALRPHIFDGDPFRLTYEKTRLFLPVGLPWRSWIEMRRSWDLTQWDNPTPILRPSLPWHRSGRLGHSVSNPCLVRLSDRRWRLYYSGGLTLLPDCGFPEPTAIGVAEADDPDGPFHPLPDPVLGAGDGPATLAAGAIKVIRVADGWVGFQNAIGWDGTHSSSAIWLLGSDDGLDWSLLVPEPLVAPTGSGWRATHVYALDVRDGADGPVMYFNARSGYHWTRGREHIGRATAST